MFILRLYNSFTEGSGWSSDWRWTNKLSYDLTINDIHKISAFVAYESSNDVYRQSGATTPNLTLYNSIFSIFRLWRSSRYNRGIFNSVNGFGESYSTNSVFGNVNYSLMDKYLFSFVIRRDGSSKFGPLNRYGTFPSYSVGWRISDEKFMQEIKWINDLKLRAAIGTNGNDAIPYGLYEDQYNY